MKQNRRIQVNIPDFIIQLVCVVSFALVVFSSSNYYRYDLFSLTARLLIILNVGLFTIIFLTGRPIPSAVFDGVKLVGIILGTAYLSCMIGRTSSLYDITVDILGYIAVPFYILLAQRIEISEKTKKVILLTAVSMALFWIYAGFLHPTYAQTGALTYGYSNSNRAGAYLLLDGAILLSSANRMKLFKQKLLLWMLTGILLWLIVLTQCRTAFLLLLAMMVYAIYPYAPKLGKKFLTLCTFIPLVFSYFYILIYNMGWLQSITIFGKSIYSGRQDLFQVEFLGFSLLGNYSVSGFGGLNLGIGLLNGFGIVGTFLFYYFMVWFNKRHVAIDESRGQKKSFTIVCFGLLMLHSCTEVFLFTCGTVYASMIGMILFLSDLGSVQPGCGEK